MQLYMMLLAKYSTGFGVICDDVIVVVIVDASEFGDDKIFKAAVQ